MRKVIVRAARTCTLWAHSTDGDFVYFRLYPKWKIAYMEMMNA